MDTKIKEIYVKANGYTFKCRTCGLNNEGDLIVFLHGFPESSLMWRDLMGVFASKGYRCFAPDQRGFSTGARPEGTENYTRMKLVSDVMALVETIQGSERFHLVAHDWGAVIGWITVANNQHRIISYTAMAVPHSDAFSYAVFNDEQQRRLSQYIFDYGPPDEPEERLGADDCAFLRKEKWNGFAQHLIDDYLDIFRVKEARTATLAWYRSLLFLGEHPENKPVANKDIQTPTLFLYGRYDPAIGNLACDLTEQYMKGYYRFVPFRGGHWMIENNTELCYKEITAHVEKFTNGRDAEE